MRLIRLILEVLTEIIQPMTAGQITLICVKAVAITYIFSYSKIVTLCFVYSYPQSVSTFEQDELLIY